MSHIIQKTCKGIWKALHEVYLRHPKSCKVIAKEFEAEWNFPHCLGALDNKHIAIDCPKMVDRIILIVKGSTVWC